MIQTGIHICIVMPNGYHALTGRGGTVAGGAEIQLALLGKLFRESGYRVTFVTGDCGQPAKEDVGGLHVVRAPFRYLGGPDRYFFSDTVALWHRLHRIGPDICLVKGPRSILFSLGLYRLFSRGRLVKIIAQESDCDPQESGLPARLYRWGGHFVDAVVFQTAHQKALGKRKLGQHGIVIPNVAHRVACGPSHAERNIDVFWAGRCSVRKRPHVFVDLAKEMPHIKCAMAVLPGDDPQYCEAIASSSRELPNLEYLGFVPYVTISECFAGASVFVSTSPSEGFPNTFLQAWQHGVPVVSLGVDPDGVITKHGLGRRCESVPEMIVAIQEMLSDRAAWQCLSERCVQYMYRYHGETRVVGRFARLFGKLNR